MQKNAPICLALAVCYLTWLAPLRAADITFVGHQDAVEADADTPTSGWRNATPSKTLDIDVDNVLGTDGYQVAAKSANPSYGWIIRRSPGYNHASSWGLWDDPDNASGSDNLSAGVFYDPNANGQVDVFELVIEGDELVGKTLRVGILYGVMVNGTSTFTVTQTVGGNQMVTTPSLTHDATSLNAAFFNITGAVEGDTFRISTEILTGSGVEQVGGIFLDSAPTNPGTQLPEVDGTVRGTYVAPLEVAGIFSDNGVIQRGMVVPVWGWDDPGTVVTVDFAGQSVNGTADANGRWEAELLSLTANTTPQTMTISAGADTVTISNLLVGDVWLCSGQSNMEMDFNGSQYAADMPAFIDPDNFPTIRHIDISNAQAEFRQKRLPNGNAGWTVCDSTTVQDYTAAGFFFATTISQETGVPIGLINSTFGNSRIGEFVTPDSIGLVTDQIPASSFRGVFTPDPCKKFFAMVAPITGYAMTGALWYQGEANANDGEDYFWKLAALFQGWRDEWQQGDFPFYYAQLPSFDGSVSWPIIRESQRRALTLTNTGMATLVDVGGVGLPWPENLHPPNKYDVGRRLAQWALLNEYGQSSVVPSGPLFSSAVFDGANVTISFDYVGSGLVAAAKPSPQSTDAPSPVADVLGFELAGSDEVWHAANASIAGSTVVLSSASVPNPEAARYLYATNTDGGTLYNLEDLPAAPFLTTAADNPNPPSTPTGLNATSGDGRVDLAWDAATGADSYNVKRSTTTGGPYASIGSPSGTSYADTTAANGTTYYYVVAAVNTIGSSADSTEVSATPVEATNPPDAPTGLSATPGDNRVDLSWSASSGADSYNVKRSTTMGGPYSGIGTTPGISYTDLSATNGTTYYYVVSASNTYGNSADSAEASATPQEPAAGAVITYVGHQDNVDAKTDDPTSGWRNTTPAKTHDIDGDNILGTDGYAMFRNNSAFSVVSLPSYISAVTHVSTHSNANASFGVMDNPSDPSGSDDINYGLWYLTTTGGTTDVFTFTITGTDLDGKTLRVGLAYDGYNGSGNQQLTITQTAGGAAADNSGTVSWGNDGLDFVFFDITEVNDGDVFTVNASAGAGLPHVSGVTFDVITDIATPPGTPTGLAATPGDGQVDLTWNVSSGAASYNVKRGTAEGGPYSTVASPTTNSFSDSTVSNGTTYYYVVSAVNAEGESPDSGEASATPQALPPDAPTGLVATPGDGQVDLSWDASSGADSYNVKRGTSMGGPYSTVASPNNNSLTDATVSNGTTYYYVVSAVNTNGESGNSGEVSATPQAAPTGATISYVGNQTNVETEASDAGIGWRNTTPDKPLDIDGDNILGTDGYRIFNDGSTVSLPSYIDNITKIAPNAAKSGGWGVIDDPSDPSGTDDIIHGFWYDSGNAQGSVDILSFQITGTALDGQTLRIGIIYDTHWGTGDIAFTLTQNGTSGSVTATSGLVTAGSDGIDVVFFDLTNVSSGDVFTLNADADDHNFSHAGGITFDTSVISGGDTLADWLASPEFGLDPADQDFGDDPDGDGHANGIENYFGTHPGEFSQGLVSGTVSGDSMTFTHPLSDSPAADISAVYRWSKDLDSFHVDGDSFDNTTVTFSQGTPADGMVEVTAAITGDPLDKLFVDIEVTQP
ncbi:hypothetical protein DDZ13_12135 [Coraliomargarita sinensis]|uniref:Fibronectin type-III domain-containing protein n=1 Tax=Coraliomargarita sinensis TaxID=2174842 RepID=A0A317ZDV8_9BACT|nr:sialate O-acetylesterase [Coraliomargarita sinensis]PXA03436.1 hypothetical protein DDZ13_12135 [Coraliomargarita sinensis]